MHENSIKIAGLDAVAIGDPSVARITIVFFHGYSMRAEDLAPVGHALGLSEALFLFPQGPVRTENGGGAWWSITPATREVDRARGPRDLSNDRAAGRSQARAWVRSIVDEATAGLPNRPLMLAGFSQGGMLACDAALIDGIRIDGLAMMSASCIAAEEWAACRSRLCGVRAFVSHGRSDPDLGFAAGERLQDFLREAGTILTWFPFDGGHQTPFPVWRKFRGFIQEVLDGSSAFNTQKLQHGTH